MKRGWETWDGGKDCKGLGCDCKGSRLGLGGTVLLDRFAEALKMLQAAPCQPCQAFQRIELDVHNNKETNILEEGKWVVKRRGYGLRESGGVGFS